MIIRQVLFGVKGETVEPLVTAVGNDGNAAKITEIHKKAATDDEYEGFEELQIWTKDRGLTRVVPLGRKKKRASLQKEEAKRLEAADKEAADKEAADKEAAGDEPTTKPAKKQASKK